MRILNLYELYGQGGLSYYKYAFLLHLREATLHRFADFWLLPNLDVYVAQYKQAKQVRAGKHGKLKTMTAAKLPTTDEFGDMAKAMYWADRFAEILPIQASLADVYTETSIYDLVFHGSTDAIALLFTEIIREWLISQAEEGG